MAKRKLQSQFKRNFIELLKLKRKRLSNKQRELTRKIKPSSWLYPFSVEKEYTKLVRTIMLELPEIANYDLEQFIEKWIKEFNGFYDIIDKSEVNEIRVKKDGFVEELSIFNQRLRDKFNQMFGSKESDIPNTDLWASLFLIANSVFRSNTRQWRKTTKKVLDFEYETSEPWSSDVTKAWAKENFTLIKSLNEEYIKKLNEIVSRGVRAGISSKDIMSEIRAMESTITKSRAKLLARDQVGKLNAQITKRRQIEIGVNYYIWNTALDERVRGRPGGRYPNAIPSHWLMQGKLCRWDDDTVYAEVSEIDDETGKINWKKRTGKMPKAIPGEEIQCRCTALAWFDNIINESDEEIQKENKQMLGG